MHGRHVKRVCSAGTLRALSGGGRLCRSKRCGRLVSGLLGRGDGTLPSSLRGGSIAGACSGGGELCGYVSGSLLRGGCGVISASDVPPQLCDLLLCCINLQHTACLSNLTCSSRFLMAQHEKQLRCCTED